MSSHEVEFIGGPLDGHKYSFTHRPEQLPALAKLAISVDVVRFLIGETSRLAVPASSSAVYCLDREGALLRYYHIVSLPVEEPQLDNA